MHVRECCKVVNYSQTFFNSHAGNVYVLLEYHSIRLANIKIEIKITERHG